MLIFDLDGTLIDSRRDIAAACNHALGCVGRAAVDEAIIATYVGDGARALVRRALGSDDDALVGRALEAFMEYYLAHPVVHTTLMPHALEALDALAHLPMAIATNKRRDVASAVIEGLGIRARFVRIWGGGDGAPKPDPACVRALLEGSGRSPRETYMIGDGAQDVGAGKAAGVRTVAVLGGFHGEVTLRALGPDHVIRSLAELPSIVR